ncbi:formate dehydrogenase accessory protein FdhE [Salmonella enterica subsp. enterica serovar Enteritidis]|nr:formate dehydrogenase accessory protein FdhE [Salmonella enterica subsp. enterica serovar Enteritidis]EBW2353103.1 formate dehydrogenase accessory protein FdhE [Salmonella enterica subsp. enterica serovar Enteritidis]EFG8199943.1 formate dehydrogenase accessory protein FdhE [Escherichia coli]
MSDLKPDPSMIGGVPKAPFVLQSSAEAVFATRARRFGFLAQTSRLAPYLTFLAQLSDLQAKLAQSLPPIAPVSAETQSIAAQAAMPPIDRAKVAVDPVLGETLDALIDGAGAFVMPEPARLALEAVRDAGADDRQWLVNNILSDHIPDDSAAPHLFAGAAVQLHLVRLAATLNAAALVPVQVGVCPACGGRPVTSSIHGEEKLENLRYATCAGCATQWNEVRIKCLCCGSTKGVSYRSVETVEATVKAEVCTECNHWVKILHQHKNHSLDPVADDVGSLGLDLLMKETGIARGGFNIFLAGY